MLIGLGAMGCQAAWKLATHQSTAYLIDQKRDYAQVLAEYDSTGVKASYRYGDDLISQTRTNPATTYFTTMMA